MKDIFLVFPRMNISIKAPEDVLDNIRRSYFFSAQDSPPGPIHHSYEIRKEENKWLFHKDGSLKNVYHNHQQIIFGLENNIEYSMILQCGDWVAFHAGSVAVGDQACLAVGNPDTGKSSSTFNLIELGHEFLCEEVALVDPEIKSVFPFLQSLKLDKNFLNEAEQDFPVRKGDIYSQDPNIIRYTPREAIKKPVLLGTILIPKYDPSAKTRTTELSPGESLTELLGYCFPPNVDEEKLFDNMIKITESCDVFRITYRNVKEARLLLEQLFPID
ncbi:hypothetical protein ACFLRM_04775 [Acidobacteriota bacterium]